MSEEQARQHPYRNVLFQALGGEEKAIAPEITATDARDGDLFLLCSDGLTDGLADKQLADLLQKHDETTPLAQICRELVEASLAASGQDNITVLLARVSGPPVSATPGTGFLNR